MPCAALSQRIGVQLRPVDGVVAYGAATVGAGVEVAESLLHGGQLRIQLVEEGRRLPCVETWRPAGV